MSGDITPRPKSVRRWVAGCSALVAVVLIATVLLARSDNERAASHRSTATGPLAAGATSTSAAEETHSGNTVAAAADQQVGGVEPEPGSTPSSLPPPTGPDGRPRDFSETMDLASPPQYPVLARGRYRDDVYWRLEGQRNDAETFCLRAMQMSSSTYQGGGGSGCHFRLPIDASTSFQGSFTRVSGPVTDDAVRVEIKVATGETVASVQPIRTSGEPTSVYITFVDAPHDPVEMVAFDASGKVIGRKKLPAAPNL